MSARRTRHDSLQAAAAPTLATKQNATAAPSLSAGWSAQVEVACDMVTTHNAAAPGDEGLIRPLLCRFLAGLLSLQAGPLR